MKKLLLLSCLVLFSCAKNLGSREDERFRFDAPQDGQVNFALLRSAVLEPQCLRCHDWVNDEAEVLERVVPGSPEKSSLFTQVDSGEMPQGGPELTDSEKQLVYDYIVNKTHSDDEANSPIVTPAPEPEPDPDPIPSLFQVVKENILKPKCLACHSWVKDDEKILKRIVPTRPNRSLIYILVKNNRMPKGGAPLSDDEKEQIRQMILELEVERD